VKICSLYGAGFYYIPGTDTCIKIGGYVRAEWLYQAGGSFNPVRVYNFDDPARNREQERTRGGITVDVRSQTAYGTLRGYATILPTATNGNAVGGGPYATPGVFAPAAFIQFAGFTFGKTASFFDFDLQPYSNQTNIWGSNQGGNGIQVFAYTAQFGNGFSASISAEDTTTRRSGVFGAAGYGGRRWPDVVANLRIDQAWGSAQIMGAIHDTYANFGGGVDDSEIGWAVGAGVRLNVPQIGKGDYLIAQVNYGEGATNYIGSNFGAGGASMALAEGFPVVSNLALGFVADAIGAGGGTNLELTTGWSITGGYEHRWNPQWKTSIYGSYGAFDYSSTASAAIAAGLGLAIANPDAGWSLWQVGSRTVWTPVPNLDLSLEILYTDLNSSSFDGAPVFGSKGYVSGIFRAQRNFWP
jgi:hypothetical protein